MTLWSNFRAKKPKTTKVLPNYKKEYKKYKEKNKELELEVQILRDLLKKIERNYDNVDRKVPEFSYTFKGKKINNLRIQELITIIKEAKTSKCYEYRKVTIVLRKNIGYK